MVLSLPWRFILILITWQKIFIFVLLFCFVVPQIFIVFGLVRLLITSWGGPTQKRIKGIITYSSIGHSGWLLFAAAFSRTVFWFYFFVYCFSFIWFVLKMPKEEGVTFFLTKRARFGGLMASFPLLNFLGLPPFPGFFVKIFVLFTMARSLFGLLALGVYLGGVFIYA